MVKLSKEVVQELEKSDSSNLLDIILEIHRQPNSMAEQEASSRTERIAALKEAFDRDIVPVEEAVLRIGGKITGHAWINRTLRARVPAGGLKELAEHERVAALDFPHPLTADSIS